MLVPERVGVPWWDYNPLRLGDWQGSMMALVTQIILALVGVGGVTVIVGWIFYAFASGRNLKQRLTDPAPFPEAEAVTT